MKEKVLLLIILFFSAAGLYAQKYLPASCATKLADLVSKEKMDTTGASSGMQSKTGL